MILQKKSSLATKVLLASLMGSLLLLNGCDKQADTPEATANTSTNATNNAATETSASSNTDQGHTNHEDHMSDAHSSTEHESHEANDMHHDEANHEGHDHEEHNEEHNHEGHEGHDHDSARIKFSCDPSKTIGVFYHADSNPKTAHLLIDGIEYDLTQVPSASGDKYTTEVGINEGQGMSWTVTGDGALLETITLDHTAKADDEKVLYSCKKAS